MESARRWSRNFSAGFAVARLASTFSSIAAAQGRVGGGAVETSGVIHFGSHALASEAIASDPLASGVHKGGIRHAELFAPVSRPYFLAPPT